MIKVTAQFRESREMKQAMDAYKSLAVRYDAIKVSSSAPTMMVNFSEATELTAQFIRLLTKDSNVVRVNVQEVK